MRIHLFEYFYNVAIEKSISKVAEKSHITQSALSQQMHKLEETLGATLFTRSNTGVDLTEEGKIVFEYCKPMLKLYNDMLKEVEGVNQRVLNITIYSNEIIASTLLPDIIYDIKELFPTYNFQLYTDFYKNKLHIAANCYDIYFTSSPLDFENILHLGSDRLVFVASTDVDDYNESTLTEIFEKPFYLLNDEVCITTAFNDFFQINTWEENNFKKIFLTDSPSHIKHTLENNSGISLLPYLYVKESIDNGFLKELDLHSESLNYTFYLAYKSNKMKEIITIIKNEFATILNK